VSTVNISGTGLWPAGSGIYSLVPKYNLGTMSKNALLIMKLDTIFKKSSEDLRASAAALYRVAFKELFIVAGGLSLHLHRRDACATI